MHPSLIILLVGVLYLIVFSGLSVVRRQRPSLRFLVEGGIITALGMIVSLFLVPLHPILLLAVVYLATMRVRLLVDLSNFFTSRGRYEKALALLDLALRLGPDLAGRQIVLINRGVTQLRMKQPEAAYSTLKEVLLAEEVKPAARYLAAGYYNMGVACLRLDRKQEAARYFRQAIEILPSSIYAQAARQALKRDEDSPIKS